MPTENATSLPSDEFVTVSLECWKVNRVNWKSDFADDLRKRSHLDERRPFISHTIGQLTREQLEPVFRADLIQALASLSPDLLSDSDFEEFARIVTSDYGLFASDGRVREAAVSVFGLILERSSVIEQVVFDKCMEDSEFRCSDRTCIRDDRKDSGTEAVLGFPDAEGWGSLETSLKAIFALLRQMASISEDRSNRLMGLLSLCCNHTNRFAREQSFLCCQHLIRLLHSDGRLGLIETNFAALVLAGLMDNWSQVRYAALQASRSLIRVHVREGRVNSLSPSILSQIMINRHFVAEGVRRYAQETWRMIFGPVGGIPYLASHIRPILDQMALSSESPNQAVREAVISLLYELLCKVFRNNERLITDTELAVVLRICVCACEDESWPVRELGARSVSTLYGPVLRNLPRPHAGLLIDKTEDLIHIIFGDVFDPMKPLRESSCEAVAVLVSVHFSRSRDNDGVWVELCRMLASKLTWWKSQNHNIEASETHENRPMYSCGTLLANNAKRPPRINLSDDCCSAGSCHSLAGSTPQDVTDGALKLSASLMCAGGIPRQLISTVSGLFWSTANDILRDMRDSTPCSMTRNVLNHVEGVLQSQCPLISEQQRLSLQDTLQSFPQGDSKDMVEQVLSLLDGLVISPEM